MSVITAHTLAIKDGTIEKLADILTRDKVFGTNTIYRYNRDHKIEAREQESIDLGICDIKIAYDDIDPDYQYMSDISEHNERHIANGWEKLKTEDAYTEFRKPWDKRVYDSLRYQCAFIPEGTDTLRWCLNYNYDDRPAYAISKKYPNITFDYKETCEGDLVVHIWLKNGKVIKDFYDEEIKNTNEEYEDDEWDEDNEEIEYTKKSYEATNDELPF